MCLFVAFLRGINVGGRTVLKETLKKEFTFLGLQKVSTFKQSGNVVFETSDEKEEEVRIRIERRLKEILGYEVPVFLRTIPQLKAIIDSEPFKRQIQEGSSCLVTFLPAAVTAFPLSLPQKIPKSTAQIIAANATEVFSVTHGGGEGALPNQFLEKILKVKATTRNLNVIGEIVEKLGNNS